MKIYLLEYVSRKDYKDTVKIGVFTSNPIKDRSIGERFPHMSGGYYRTTIMTLDLNEVEGESFHFDL